MKLPNPLIPRCSDEEWQAYWRIGQIREIASPGFVRRLEIAREEGLLIPLLAGDLGTAEILASECIKSLSGQIHWVYPPPSPVRSPILASIDPSECGE